MSKGTRISGIEVQTLDEQDWWSLKRLDDAPDAAPIGPSSAGPSLHALPPHLSGNDQDGRWGNPTWTALEQALGALEDAEVVTFPSGMAAIAAVFFATLKPGDRVLLPADGYYTTHDCAAKYLAPMGVAVDTAATAQLDAHALDGYRLVMTETPSNPGLDLADIAAISARVRAAGGLTVVDNTTMTPLGQRPLDLGADFVVSADIKALNGHSDVLFGHVASRHAERMAAVREWRRLVGALPGPFESWLGRRGLETLEARFARMCASAQTLAERLTEHPAVRAVRYPGLPDHPQHALARRQMTCGGALIGLTLADEAAAERFVAACPLLRPATRFSGSLAGSQQRPRWSDQVAEGFVRLSVGCEPTEVLWQALEQALGT